MDAELELEEPRRGQRLRGRQAARADDAARRPRELFAGSTVAREAFGEEVVDALPQQRPTSSSTAFDAAVTDWERVRGFERL